MATQQRNKRSESTKSKSSGSSGGKQPRPESQRKSQPGQSSRGRGSGSGKHEQNGKAAGQARGPGRQQEQPDQQQESQGGAMAGVKKAGSTVADTVRQHPIAAGFVGAGIAAGISYFLYEQFKDRGDEGLQGGEREGRQEDYDQDEGESDSGEYGEASAGDDEGGEEEGDDDADEEDSSGGMMSSVSRGARQGYQVGKQKASNLLRDHPMATGVGLLALGTAAGLLFPSTNAEKKLLDSSGGIAKKAKRAGQELWQQGKDMASRVMTEGMQAVADEAEREGLTPERLARKVKRIAGRVRDAVSDAAEK